MSVGPEVFEGAGVKEVSGNSEGSSVAVTSGVFEGVEDGSAVSADDSVPLPPVFIILTLTVVGYLVPVTVIEPDAGS